ncbi:acyloxyacyl hydrolase [uncultured Desulfobacter sp.]|uniref:acyloxyacyl hydrolase n=1 Tax=uncultured Desulfobacter sp. TaxID=240139 RepID=UPI002AABD0C6|nr:acyloxyacyl hydrolase [uncultured Desulfobacter sp.]
MPLTILVLFFCFSAAQLRAEEYAPTLNGMSLNLGYTYDPSYKTSFAQVSVLRLYDYDRVWKHKAPENLRFKVESSLGGARWNETDIRIIASVNIFAMLYLTDSLANGIRPYVEAGIGGIYTDYRVYGQDYRFNFNPQAGIGLEFSTDNNATWFSALRIHHLSNAGLGDTNRGQNSVILLIGQYF